jgi:NADH-quinone oxidoreductase subunit H
MSALIVTLFLGGWRLPWVTDQLAGWPLLLVSAATFAAKIAVMLWVFVWVRWSLPRFRYDQLMRLGWKGLLPLAALNLVWVGFAMTMGWL